jgi:hypothetical protein
MLTTHASTEISHETSTVECHDRVSVPDGRIGEVIGFYRRSFETVLVRFAGGDSGEFPMERVERLR